MIIDVKTATGTQQIWKQERLVLSLKASVQGTPGVSVWTDLHGNQSSPLASYTPCTDGTTLIDMTDYVRTYPSVAQISVHDADAHNVYNIAVSVVGLINPAGLVIPYQPLSAANALIVPPSMMMYDGTQNDLIEAELYATAGTWSVNGHATLATSKRYIGQITGAFYLSNGTYTKHYMPRLMVCDRLYAQVRWVSCTGQERVHFWEVTKNTIAAANGYSLMPIENEYVEIKGREEGMTLRLDGLDAYDMWYYADILASSKVEIYDGKKWARVSVTTKDATMPDGNNHDGVLEIKIDYKRYDAVAM